MGMITELGGTRHLALGTGGEGNGEAARGIVAGGRAWGRRPPYGRGSEGALAVTVACCMRWAPAPGSVAV
jgi:hypothetical protein